MKYKTAFLTNISFKGNEEGRAFTWLIIPLDDYVVEGKMPARFARSEKNRQLI